MNSRKEEKKSYGAADNFIVRSRGADLDSAPRPEHSFQQFFASTAPLYQNVFCEMTEIFSVTALEYVGIP